MSTKTSIHQLQIDGLDGKPIQFSAYEGKKILLVNVASACGFTPQYEALQEFYEANIDKLVVIGIPCNDFGQQEPGTAEEIQSFCQLNYGVTFPLAAKLKITDSPRSPLYNWLCERSLNGVQDSQVKWNFHKFLLDEKGELLKDFPSAVSPLDAAISDKI